MENPVRAEGPGGGGFPAENCNYRLFNLTKKE